jgi:hypothetical protein
MCPAHSAMLLVPGVVFRRANDVCKVRCAGNKYPELETGRPTQHSHGLQLPYTELKTLSTDTTFIRVHTNLLRAPNQLERLHRQAALIVPQSGSTPRSTITIIL